MGIITTQYGSGVAKGKLSITHQEMKKAIALNKPRWILAHDQVVFARRLLKDLECVGAAKQKEFKLKKGASSIDDLRIIKMYEDAIIDHMPLDERQGNWVQKFERDDDANLFIVAQFSRYQEVEQHIKENFDNPDQIRQNLEDNDNE